jgi:hypothetical protein
LADGFERVAEAVLIKDGKAGFGEPKLFLRDQRDRRDAVHEWKIARFGTDVHVRTVGAL